MPDTLNIQIRKKYLKSSEHTVPVLQLVRQVAPQLGDPIRSTNTKLPFDQYYLSLKLKYFSYQLFESSILYSCPRHVRSVEAHSLQEEEEANPLVVVMEHVVRIVSMISRVNSMMCFHVFVSNVLDKSRSF